jgi:hypothetical protein
MTMPQFIRSLDRKMAAHAKKTKLPDKLVPPANVQASRDPRRAAGGHSWRVFPPTYK